MGTTAHDVAALDTSLPLLSKQAFMVEAAYEAAPGASWLLAVACCAHGLSPYPLQLETAQITISHHAVGILRCIAWTVEDKTEGHPARCASYQISLAWDERAGTVTAQSVELLRRSKLPPHAVRSGKRVGSVG